MTHSDVQAGTRVVKLLIGGGIETASIAEVEHVDAQNIYLKGCDGDYNSESVYAYHLADGRACSSYIPGFTSRLIVLEED